MYLGASSKPRLAFSLVLSIASLSTITLTTIAVTPSKAIAQSGVKSLDDQAFLSAFRKAQIAQAALAKRVQSLKAQTKSLTDNLPTAFDETAAGRLKTLAETLGTITTSKASAKADLTKSLIDTRDELNVAYEKVKALNRKKEDTPADVLSRMNDYPEFLESIQGTLDETPDNPLQDLKEALGKILDNTDSGQGFSKSALNKVTALNSLLDVNHNAPQDVAALRRGMVAELPATATSLQYRRDIGIQYAAFVTAWKAMQERCKAELSLKDPSPAPLSEFDKSLKSILGNLPANLNHVGKNLGEQGGAAQELRYAISRGEVDKLASRVITLAALDSANNESLSVIRALVDIRTQVQLSGKASYLPSTSQTLAEAANSFERSEVELASILELLRKSDTIDKKYWVSEAINLYYFDDIARLMRTLLGVSPTVIDGDDEKTRIDSSAATTELIRLQAEKVEKQRLVTEARIQLSTALARIEQERNRFADQQKAVDDQKKTADTSLETLNAKQDAATQIERQRKANKDILEQRQEDLKKLEATETPDQPRIQQLRDEIARRTTTEIRLGKDEAAARAAVDTAKASHDKDAAAYEAANTKLKADLDAFAEQEKKLREEFKTAQDAATTANAKFSEATTNVFLQAFTENQLFAKLREKGEPFYEALPTGGDDPVKRVALYGFKDSRTLFLRGAPEDVQRAKRLIALFDRPQGQAYITLYNMEITDDGDVFGANRTSLAYRAIQKSINDVRSNTDELIVAFKDSLMEVIEELEKQPDRITPSVSEYTTQRKNQLITQLQLGSEDNYVAKNVLSYGLQFYDSEVTNAFFGKDSKDSKNLYDDATTEYTASLIPDLHRTTTLAEALIAFSLMDSQVQGEIIKRFDTKLKNIGVNNKTIKNQAKSDSSALTMRTFYRFVGSWKKKDKTSTSDVFVPGAGILSFKQELIQYLKQTAFDRASEDVTRLLRHRQIEKEQEAIFKDQNKTQQVNNGVSPKEKIKITDSIIYGPSSWLYRQYFQQGPNSDENLRKFMVNITPKEFTDFIDAVRQSKDSDASQNARASALNEALKKFIQSLDDDVQEGIVEPGLEDMRVQVYQKSKESKRKLRFGLINRTRILATNRVLSRVNGSASLSLSPNSKDETATEAAAQFGQLALTALAPGSGSLLAPGLNSLSGLAANNPLSSLLGGLAPKASTTGTSVPQSAQSAQTKEELPQQPEPGVYAIGTSGIFQVSPVFDPTGQALRFRLDYVARSQVKEPDGTIDPVVPKIDYHSVNVDVQLSNHEIRLVSDYSVNAQIGRPAIKEGGIPILKDTPVLKDIPLIGWFTKRASVPGQSTQSIIFAHTTMYPTISDVIALLYRAPTIRIDPSKTFNKE